MKKPNKYESQNNIIRREKLKNIVIELYNEKHNLKAVGIELNIHPKTVARILKDNNISYKGRGYASQKVFTNPFNNKSIEDKSYWLGFLAGDGYIHPKKNLIHICSIDKEIIENYKKFIGEGLGITYHNNSKNTIYIATFSHKETKDYLVKRGITTKKSLTLSLKVILNWNIIRGLFDADGSFSQNRFKITSGSNKLILQLETFFNKEGFKVSIKIKGKAKDIYILGGKEQLKLLYNKMYNTSNYFLTRKKEKIRRYIE